MTLEGAPRLLVVRRDNIGDLVCTTPLIAALRKRYPSSYLAVLANSYNQAVLEGNPDIDQVFAYTKFKHRPPGQGLLSALSDRVGFLRALRRARIDIAILATPQYQARLIRLMRWAGVKRVAGFVASQSDTGLDLEVPQAEGRGLHEVEDVFRLANLLDVDGAPPAMKIFPNADRAEAICRTLQPKSEPHAPRIAIHISARKPSQRWPAERFVELIRALHSSHQAQVILLWSPGAASDARHPGDDEKAKAVLASMGEVPVSAVPTTSLQDLIAALSLCELLICADGGAMHIGAALGKPTVALFGDSHLARWRPWGVSYEVLQAPSRHVEAIPVSEVMAAAGRLLNRS